MLVRMTADLAAQRARREAARLVAVVGIPVMLPLLRQEWT
jgi:hypothetical protein